ncbi:MAG TPA: SAM-dependent methyltransferase [Candidatus Hydrogenedentes bacterium]|nr:SAM-dependent methyltransferase [Candidatus Hydrogenedentota bacterium]
MLNNDRVSSSFRDPSGFLFSRDGVLYRQVNQSYREQYDLLMKSGLYSSLVSDGQLVAHDETDAPPAQTDTAYKIIRPAAVPFISYPYEWPFSALKRAALATLAVQGRALEYGMTLKDASAYNVQFVDGKPLFVDTLSFEAYREGAPWVAYGQFCQHFVAPLVLMARRDVRLGQLSRVFIDGVPLDLASKMLPRRTYLSPGILLNIHLHAKSQARHAGDATAGSASGKQRRASGGSISRRGMLGLLDNLRSLITKLAWTPSGTAWSDYYEETNYTQDALNDKRRWVAEYLERVQPATVWDLGANTGLFSRIASEKGILTISFDVDPGAVEKNYLSVVENKERQLLPLLLDLANPSPAIGWQNRERDSLIERGPADAVLALALIHHLAIANNVPLPMLADFFAELCRSLIIEFVPKRDSQVRRLLARRQDIFPDYTQSGFETAFRKHFRIEDNHPVTDSARVLYLMRKN